MNYTYIVQCADGTLYTGWTNCLEKRLKAHNSGKNGAKYTKTKRPVTLVYYEGYATKEEAMSREYAIKQLTRAKKFALMEFWDGRGSHVFMRASAWNVFEKNYYTGIFATKQYITIKWQALPSIINTWKISCDPKFLCLALKMGSFSA